MIELGWMSWFGEVLMQVRLKVFPVSVFSVFGAVLNSIPAAAVS